MNDKIHFRDIKEPGVYQPIVPESVSHIPDLYQKYKLVVISNGSGKESGVNKIWKDTVGNACASGEEISARLFSYSEEQIQNNTHVLTGYTNLFYRKCEHLEFFVGIKLKE